MTVYYRRRPGRLRQVLNLEEFRPPNGYVEPSTCVSDSIESSCLGFLCLIQRHCQRLRLCSVGDICVQNTCGIIMTGKKLKYSEKKLSQCQLKNADRQVDRQTGRLYVMCVCVCVCVCMHVRTYICMYVRIYVCMYVCMYVCTYVCMYVRTYVCMYVCMHTGM